MSALDITGTFSGAWDVTERLCGFCRVITVRFCGSCIGLGRLLIIDINGRFCAFSPAINLSVVRNVCPRHNLVTISSQSHVGKFCPFKAHLWFWCHSRFSWLIEASQEYYLESLVRRICFGMGELCWKTMSLWCLLPQTFKIAIHFNQLLKKSILLWQTHTPISYYRTFLERQKILINISIYYNIFLKSEKLINNSTYI